MTTPAEQYEHLLAQSSQYQRSHQRPDAHNLQQHRPPMKPGSHSTRSDKSHRSGGSKSDIHHESKGLSSKADPSLAINEAEPATMAVMEATNHIPLRSMQHKDAWGNPITDPDKSNPTRNRWERPLDTIRGFEAAIDGGYLRKILNHSESQTSDVWSQRGGPRAQNQPRNPQDGYYGNRAPSVRADMQYGGTARNSYLETQEGYGGYSNRQSRALPRDRSQRLHPDQQYQGYGREQNVYPVPQKDRSYETVTSAGGHSDHAGYQTDPTSSDNSVDHRVAPTKRLAPNEYGAGSGFGPNGGGHGHHSHFLPSPPAESGHFDSGPSVPPKKISSLNRQVTPPPQDGHEKRKSWFSRRFSKDT